MVAAMVLHLQPWRCVRGVRVSIAVVNFYYLVCGGWGNRNYSLCGGGVG